MQRTYTNIAIDGGGASVCVYLGALAAMVNIKNVFRFMGVSVGALLAVMLAMGHTIGDIMDIADRTVLRDLAVPSLSDLWNARKNGGILGNDKLMPLVDAHLEEGLVHVYPLLPIPEAKGPRAALSAFVRAHS